MKLSYGSARYLGLVKSGPKIDMKTLYIMVGEKCRFDCAYCSQARSSLSSVSKLSRVVWPEFSMGEILRAVEKYHESVKRICFQVVSSEDAEREALQAVRTLKSFSIPISASVRIFRFEEAEKWFEAGVERLGVATDVVSEGLYSSYRGGQLGEHLKLLFTLSRVFQKKITTHAIVGLGESEREMVEFLQRMHEWKITVGLFAFTPLKGTRLERAQRPSLESYRRIQVAHYFIRKELISLKDISFSSTGKIESYGVKVKIPPEAFLTTGCPNCTRPFYNEEPGKELYNFFDVGQASKVTFET